MKKIWSILFALLLAVNLIPGTVFAEGISDIENRILLKLDFEDTVEPSVGTIAGQNGSFSYTEGKRGKAAVFTEGNYIDLGEIDFTSSKTIGMWLQVTRFNNEDDPVIFGNKSWYDTKEDGMILAMVKPDQLKYNWGNTATGERKDIKYDYSYNTWMYVVIAADREAGSMNFYVDGELFTSMDFSDFANSCLNGPDTFKLGNDGTGAYDKNDSRYEFLADTFTIFDGALTQEEVNAVIAGTSDLDSAWMALNEERILGNNPSLSEVTGDLVLPKEIEGVAVTWISDHSAVDERGGFVYRGMQDTSVTLTAILNDGTHTEDKEFKVLVKGHNIGGKAVFERDMQYPDSKAFFADGYIFESPDDENVDNHGELVFEDSDVFLKRKTYGSASAGGVRIKKDFAVEESTDPYVVAFTIEQVNGNPIYLEGTSTSRGWQPLFTMALENDKLTINANSDYGTVEGVANQKLDIRVEIDGVNKNMDVYVNEALAFPDVPFRNSSATMVERLLFLAKGGAESKQNGGLKLHYIALRKAYDDTAKALLEKADIHAVTDENTNRITKNLHFGNEEGITWRSSDESVIAADGTVIRGTADETVTLWADFVTVRNRQGIADQVFQIVNEREMPALAFQKNQKLRIEYDGYPEEVSPVLALYRDGELIETVIDGGWLTVPGNTLGCSVKGMLLDLKTMKPWEKAKTLYPGEEGKTTVKIGIFSDLHIDMIPRGYERLEYFMEQMQEEQVDLIISLGDFVNAEEENKPVVELFRSTDIPAVSVIGNHDLDTSTRAQQLAFTGETQAYYSKDIGNVHCIFLDTNYKSGDDYILPEEQLKWLKKDMAMTTKPCILFSHEELRFLANSDAVLNIMQSSGATVIAAVNGHNHVDGFNEFGPYHSIDINSMAGQWLGTASNVERLNTDYYTQEEYDKYTSLKYTAPYADPVFAVYTIDTEARSVSVKGRTSSFIWKTPKERGHYSNIYGIPYTASIEDREFTY